MVPAHIGRSLGAVDHSCPLKGHTKTPKLCKFTLYIMHFRALRGCRLEGVLRLCTLICAGSLVSVLLFWVVCLVVMDINFQSTGFTVREFPALPITSLPEDCWTVGSYCCDITGPSPCLHSTSGSIDKGAVWRLIRFR